MDLRAMAERVLALLLPVLGDEVGALIEPLVHAMRDAVDLLGTPEGDPRRQIVEGTLATALGTFELRLADALVRLSSAGTRLDPQQGIQVVIGLLAAGATGKRKEDGK